ncbi:MAG: STAS domain-containing protein [Candidatus Kapaibacterium sp.]|jgi:anti-sigma B factor antagonist
MSHNFDIQSTKQGTVQILRIKGFLDAHTAHILERTIEEKVKAKEFSIIVNFKDLDYISSAGLGVFMVFIEEIRSGGGDIKLVEMKPKVFTVFDLLGFPMLFDILPNEQEAVSKFHV